MSTLKNFYKTKNTQFLLTCIVFLIAIIPTICGIFIYYYFEKNSLTMKTVSYEQMLLTDAENSFDNLVEHLSKCQYEITSLLVTLNVDKIDFCNLKKNDIESIRTIENLLQSIRRTSKGIYNIYILNTDTSAVYSSTYSYSKEQLLTEPWLNQSYSSSQEWNIIPEHATEYVIPVSQNASMSSCTSFVTGLANQKPDGTFKYILQIDIYDNYLKSLLENIATSTDDKIAVYFNSKLFFSQNYKPSTDFFQNNSDSFHNKSAFRVYQEKGLVLSQLYMPDLDLLIKKSSNPFSFNLDSLLWRLLIFAGMLLILAAFLAAAIANFFSQPFDNLIKNTMHSLENTSRLKPVNINSSNTYTIAISEHFNVLIQQINHLMDRNIQQEKDKRKLQIKMLQSQINPHFLYNTLNSIKWMALMKQQCDIAQTITSLVDLLEYCCKDTDTFVFLKDEIQFLKDYIKIQENRNIDKKITVLYDVCEVASCKIIKFSLQPAVENAFLHAFTNDSINPIIHISGMIENNTLIIKITDNGIGFDTNLINKNMTGIGIKNVDERIKLYYGNNYGLSIHSQLKIGTEVTITFPLSERIGEQT